ncbi:peptidase M23 [Meiothermus phage MMP17]|nr:M23 family metallopeptidase [Meiothermus phage MMP7]QAY18044.1 peptidase M23 [Meiothermus phage MMP17]
MRIVHPFPQPARARVDAGFLDPRYPQWRRAAGLAPAEHTGVDYNLVGTSGDADLGYPVVAMADGIVRHARAHRIWGNIVLLEHPQLGLWSQYAHLYQLAVDAGQEIWAGEPLGSIGRGDPRAPFLAHLHFEIRTRPLPADNWPGMNKTAIKEGYLDPETWLKQHMATERRFTRQGLVLWLPDGKHSMPGKTIVNLDDPTLVHVRTNRALQ